MARQPLIALVLLAACDDAAVSLGTFDVPEAAAVLQPESGGPFEEPVGYVASTQGGQIALLALRSGRYLTDDAAASFARGTPLATGYARVLASLAVHAPAPDQVDVYASDRAFGRLLRVPHVLGLDRAGVPQRPALTHTDPVFVDADASGDAPELREIELRPGASTTEDWTLEFDGDAWWASGSRSGPQPEPLVPGEAWTSRRGELALLLRGGATRGDHFTFSVDSGLEELDPDGTPGALALAPDGSVLALVVERPGKGPSVVRWLEPSSGAFVGEVDLPVGAEPRALTWAEGALWIADGARPAVYEVRRGEADDEILERSLPWSVLDLAYLASDGDRLLYLLAENGRDVYLYDLDQEALRDVNPWTSGPSPMTFPTPVQGLAAIPLEYPWPEADPEGVVRRGTSVGVSLSDARVVFMEAGTGCLVRDTLGPRTLVSTQYSGPIDYDTNFASSTTGPYLEPNPVNGRSVQVNPCAGLALEETWTLTFDQTRQAWELEGSLSGVQSELVRSDVRYVSDRGEVSFTLRSGTQLAEDGWQITFGITPGFLEADGNNDDDSAREVRLDLPSKPVFFHYRTDVPASGWTAVDDRPFLLVPAAGGDLVGRLEPGTGLLDVSWW